MKPKRPKIFTARTISTLAIIVIGILLYMALSNFAAVSGAFRALFSIFSPFVWGVVLAYLLNMPMRFLERRVFKTHPKRRVLSILVTYLAFVLLVVLLIMLVLPQVLDSLRILLGNLSYYLDNLNRFVDNLIAQYNLSPEIVDSVMGTYNEIVTDLAGTIRAALPDIVSVGMQFGSDLVSGIIKVFTAIIASIYMLASKEKLLIQCRRVLFALLPQRHASSIARVGRLSNGVFSGFISGKLLDSAIIGIICFVFMSLMNILSSVFGIPGIQMPYAPLISVIIGITNVIPFFGPFIGAIPSVMILLMINLWSGIWFTVFIIVLQQFDGNILGPKILSGSTGLPAMWVLVAIIVGGGLFGFTGMLLGVPTTAVLYTLASDFIENRLRKKGLATQPELLPAEATAQDIPPPPAATGAPGTEEPPDAPAGPAG